MSATAGPSKKSKRPRLVQNYQTISSATAPLTRLPIEILAEILLYTCSPPTVLAVSRTCSFLYQSLAQNPSAYFIWRGARETCKPAPLPEPGTLWKSEADYAAFVFGGGACNMCGKVTHAMYTSFATQIRLCGSWTCRRMCLNGYLVNVAPLFSRMDAQAVCVRSVESGLCFYPSATTSSMWPQNDRILVRKTDVEKCKLDVAAYGFLCAGRNQADVTQSADSNVRLSEEMKLDIQRHRAEKLWFGRTMELSCRLVLWKCNYDREYKSIKNQNKTWTKSFAKSEGWNFEDLLTSQTYGAMQSRKNRLLEKIELDDVSSIRSTMEAELLTMQERHKRQKAEGAYKEKLTEVKKIYERMRCGTVEGVHSDPGYPLILPTLSVFCTLPFLRTLKGSPDPNTVPIHASSSASDIELNSLTTSLIMSDIHTWLTPVQKHLMAVLGYPNGWQSASTRTLPPLKRVTARFFCKRCGEGRVGRKYQREQCLDLKGVCSHVCVKMQGKRIEGRRQEVPEESEIDVPSDDDETREEKRGKGKDKKMNRARRPDWRVNLFEKDEKAIRFIKTILDLTGLSEEDPSTIPALSAEGGVILQCLSCTGWIVMDFATAIGHAHRHECMQIQLLPRGGPCGMATVPKHANPPSVEESATIVHIARLTFQRGGTEFLLGPAYRGHKYCERANYGCKHCFSVFKDSLVDGEECVTLTASGKGALRAMSFNALRSHVKAKHGVENIHDEDFFCYFTLGLQSKQIRGVVSFEDI